MTGKFEPRRDSLAARIITFFRENPEEELTLEDIRAKFDVARGAVHTHLAAAVTAGMLARSDETGDWIYTPGKALSEPAPKAAAGQRINPQTVSIDDGIPIPEKEEREPRGWAALLERLKPGQSCLLPMKNRSTILTVTRRITKAGKGKFTKRTEPDGVNFRVWRTE